MEYYSWPCRYCAGLLETEGHVCDPARIRARVDSLNSRLIRAERTIDRLRYAGPELHYDHGIAPGTFTVCGT